MSYYQAKAYVNYLWNAKNEHAVHSPFLFELINHVLYKPEITPELKELDAWYAKLTQSSVSFKHTDLGAGSKSGKAGERQIGEYTRKVSKPKKYRHLLYQLAKYLNTSSILELGTATGVSGAYLQRGNPGSKFISLEGCPALAGIAFDEWKKLGLENSVALNASFDDKLQAVASEYGPFDLIYLDGNHKEEPTIRYFEQLLKATAKNACFLVDDIYWSKEMTTAWQYIKDHQAVTQTVDLFQMGLAFTNPDLSKQDFVLRY